MIIKLPDEAEIRLSKHNDGVSLAIQKKQVGIVVYVSYDTAWQLANELKALVTIHEAYNPEDKLLREERELRRRAERMNSNDDKSNTSTK